MRGLLCIEPLYHQIVAGNKSQTRRSGGLDEVNDFTIQMNGHQRSPDDCTLLLSERIPHEALLSTFSIPWRTEPIVLKSRYKFGEVLYLKEPYIFLQSDNVDFWNGYAYKFGARKNTATSDRGCELGGPDFKFKNKLFMPAEAAREFIKITGIRCERLLDISDEDCLAEGIEKINEWTGLPIYKNYLNSSPVNNLSNVTGFWNDAKQSFLSLYKFANRVKEVQNLWVWVYEFELL